MAKIVIAGSANCPYYAKVELLADSLVKNLPDFNLHKIVKQPQEWQTWLSQLCQDRGWSHGKSPIIWRELLDRGGKGILIGGANDFQEYAAGYYGINSSFKSVDMNEISDENLKTKVDIDEEERERRSRSKPVQICITSATSPLCYSMVHAVAKGDVFGPETEVALHLYDCDDSISTLGGVEMEAVDLSCPLLRQVHITSKLKQAFADCSAIVLLDELVKEDGISQEDWLKKNHELFSNYAKIIEEVAKKDVKIILAGNGPVNFNAYMMMHSAPDIPKQNIVAMSRMLENRAKAVLAGRLNVNSANVVDVSVWGNANGTSFVDVSMARVHQYDGAIWGPPSYSVSAVDMVHDDKWLKTEFLDLLAKRQAEVENAMKHSAAMSHAAAAASLLQHWWSGTPSGQFFSLGVCSEGWYDIPESLVFSFPVVISPKGEWEVVKDIQLNEEGRTKIQNIVKELQTECEVIFPPLKPPTPVTEEKPPSIEEVPENLEDKSSVPEEQKQSENEEETGSTKESVQSEGGDVDEQTVVDH